MAEKKYDVITIGSATRDIYIQSKAMQSVKDNVFHTGEGICVPSGSKVPVEDLQFTTGGSAVNAAVTFAYQGLKTAIVCKVGADNRGDSVKELLDELGVSTEHMVMDKDLLTAVSIIFHSPGGERSIFVYRGASSHLRPEEVDFDFLKQAKWIYMTHLGGESAALFEPILKTAKDKGVKVALNPGSTQFKMGEDLVPFLKYVDVLFVNQEEAALLTGMDFKKEEEIFKKLDEWIDGIIVMTKGPDGVSVSDGKNKWDAPSLKEPKFVDRTGAGDAFGAGFITAMIKTDSIEDAIQLGSANATAVLGEWGSNRGLLEGNDSPEKFGKLEIKRTKV
ncbi:MAG: carbohydrate kinase family protein [Candidatus Spechtbacterales bacterium]